MTLPIFRLADFFPAAELKCDGFFAWTLYPRASRPQALCYALAEDVVDLINANPNITCVITLAALAGRVASGKGVAVSARPQEAYYQLHNRLFREGLMKIHQDNFIHPGASIAPTAVIGQNVVIGDGVTIGPHAVIEDYSIIGEGRICFTTSRCVCSGAMVATITFMPCSTASRATSAMRRWFSNRASLVKPSPEHNPPRISSPSSMKTGIFRSSKPARSRLARVVLPAPERP